MQFSFGGNEAGQFAGTCLQWRRVMLRDAFCADDDTFILLHLDEIIDECWDTSLRCDHPSEFGAYESGQIRGGRKGNIVVYWDGADDEIGSAFFRFKPSWNGNDNQNHYLLEGRANITKGEDNLLALTIGGLTISGAADIIEDEWHSIGFTWDAVMPWWELDGVTCLEYSGYITPGTDSTADSITSGDPWTVSFKANTDTLTDITAYDSETGRMTILYRTSGPHNGIYDGSYHDVSLLVTGRHKYSVTSDGAQITCYRDGAQIGSPFASVVGLTEICKWGSDYLDANDWSENLINVCIHDTELSLSQVETLHEQMDYTGENVLVFDGLIIAESSSGSFLQNTDLTGYLDHGSVYDEILGLQRVLTRKELIELHDIYLSGTYISPIYHIGNEQPVKVDWISIEPTGYEIEKLEYRCSYSKPNGDEVETNTYDADNSWGAITDWEILTQGLGVTDQRSFIQFKATLKKS